mgnify:CR=1 FL=1
MIYLDTNIIIYVIEKNQKYEEACKKILKDIKLNKFEVASSIHLLVELVIHLNKLNKLLKEKLNIEENINAVLSLPIKWLDLNFAVIKRASQYNYSVSPGDYLHIATAEINNINEIISADSDFDKIDFIKRIDPLKY